MQLQRMIRKDGFKLILCPKIQQVFLYDLVGDPNEGLGGQSGLQGKGSTAIW